MTIILIILGFAAVGVIGVCIGFKVGAEAGFEEGVETAQRFARLRCDASNRERKTP